MRDPEPGVTTDTAPTSRRGARDVILREAAELFATKGYAESGLREIAERAGVGPSTIYHHFGSKEHIYEEIIRRAVDEIAASVRAELAALPPNADVRARFNAAVRGHLYALHAHKPFTSTNAHSRIKVPAAVDAAITRRRRGYANFWRELFAEAERSKALKPGLDIKLLRPLVLETLNRTVAWFDERQGNREKLAMTMTAMFAGIWANDA